MPVTKMTLHYARGAIRKPPRVGDRRLIRGVEHIRVFRRRGGCVVVSNGRHLYDWVPLGEACDHGAAHWLTPAERQILSNKDMPGTHQTPTQGDKHHE
jgi:hypothetical protein